MIIIIIWLLRMYKLLLISIFIISGVNYILLTVSCYQTKNLYVFSNNSARFQFFLLRQKWKLTKNSQIKSQG